MTYLRSLSKAQWIWLTGTAAAAILIVLAGWSLEPEDEAVPVSRFTTAMAIRDLAPELGVTPKAPARELGLPIEARKGRPLEQLGISHMP